MESNILAIHAVCVFALPVIAVILSMASRRDSNQERLLIFAQTAAFISAATALLLKLFIGSTDIAAGGLLRVDILAATLLLLISFIASVVVSYSDRYMLGDANKLEYTRCVLGLAAAASLLVLSNNLFLSLMSWTIISWLLFRAVKLKNPASAAVVLKHHIASDVLMFAACLTLVVACGTADMSAMSSRMDALKQQPLLMGASMPWSHAQLAALLLVLSMSIKSALFPFNRWLLATIDTMTPLSGLLHAGIVNVSAVIAARLFDVLSLAPGVLAAWAVLSIVSVLVGTLSMSAQYDVKRKLVYSTVGQMGFMCLQCALGFVPGAVFHLIAHGLFKCHLFLQSGSAISEALAKKRWGAKEDMSAVGAQDVHVVMRGKLTRLIIVSAMVASLLYVSIALGGSNTALMVSFAVAICSVLLTTPSFSRVNGPMLAVVATLWVVAVAISVSLAGSLEAAIALPSQHDSMAMPAAVGFLALCGLAFAALSRTHTLRSLYVHALNGFYLDEIAAAAANRLRS